MSLTVKSNSAQHNSINERNRVTLEGRAANAPVAKQWQTAGRQCCPPGLVKTSRLPTAMRSKTTTEIFSRLAVRGSQQANTSQQGFVRVCGKLLVNVQTNSPHKCSQPTARPNRQPPPVAWKETSGQRSILYCTEHICIFLFFKIKICLKIR